MKILIHPHTTNNFQVQWCCPRTELIVLEGLMQLDEVELVDNEREADYVIWHHVPQNNGEKSFELINRIDPKKLIVIDSIDENDQWFLPELDPNRYFLYFKRSICKTNSYGEKTQIELQERQFPWDYAILKGMCYKRDEKQIDIGCYLRPSCTFRILVLQAMQALNYPNKRVGEISSGSRSIGTEVYFDDMYFLHLQTTKIIVSSGPFGWTGCSRPSEAFANYCLYMSNEAYEYMPNKPENEVHWFKINPLDPYSIYSALEFYLRYPESLNAVAERGHEYAMQYHTSKARMEYVIGKIKQYAK